MMTNTTSPKITTLAAWTIVVLISALPKIIVQEVFGRSLAADTLALFSLGVLAAALLVSFLWQPLRSLRPLIVLFAVLVGSQWFVYNRLDTLPFFASRLRNPSFKVFMITEQGLNLLVTLTMIAALLLMRKKPAEFYLALGDPAAPASPIPWMGVKAGDTWKTFGIWLTVCISLGTLAFLVIAGRPPLDIVVRALPFLPFVLINAALNAFNEEVTYKASFLSVLGAPVGARQAIYLVAYFFGVGHFYGVPYGVVGVVLATFLGWILARSMHETRGLFWAWFIHFWQDVWIFSFLAIGSIIPGGG